MPFCQQRSCGCSLISNSLILTGDGSPGSPWQIEGAAPQRMTEAQRLALTGVSLYDGLFVWTTDQDILWVHNGSAWERVGSGWVTYTPVMANWTTGASGSTIGRYTVMRGMCYVSIISTFQSGATFAGSPTWTLPFPAIVMAGDSFSDYLNGSVHYSTATIFSLKGRLQSPGDNRVYGVLLGVNTPATSSYVQEHSGLISTSPMNWATAPAGCQIYFNGWYPIA